MALGLFWPGGGSDQGVLTGPTRFANGYLKQFELVAPAAITGAVTAYEWLDSTQSAELKTVANSGYVESSAGKDIRYELLDGTKVPHKLLTYDGAAGRLIAVVLYQTVSGSTDNRLFRYVGNPTVAAATSEEDAAGTFTNCAEVWQPGNTASLTGSGRTLSTQGVVASEAVDTFNFGSVLKITGAAGYLYLTDGSSWLNSVNALSFIVIAKAATGYANTQGMLSIGGVQVAGGNDLSVSLVLRYEASGHPLSAPPTNVLAYADTRTDPTNLAVARDGRARLESVANFQNSAWHTYLVNRATDSVEHLGIDGALPSELYTSDGGLQGPLALGSPAKIRIGTSPHAQNETTGDWNGLIAYVRLGSTQLSAAWWAAFDLNYRNPLAFYGTSVARGISGNRGPVATPKHATVAAGGSVTVNVLAGATSPDGLTLTVVACSLPSISGATRALASPSVTYHAPAATVGLTDEVTFTVQDSNGLQSLAKLRVAITNGSPVVAVADTATCAYQSSVTVDVLANDTGGLTTLSTSAFDAASAHSGTIARAAAPNANKLVYTAPSGFSGTDTFSYTATDGTTSSSATVTVTVSAAAGLTAVNDQFVVSPSATTACDVLANDTGTTGILDLPAGPSFGSATIAAGKVSYVAGAAAGPDQLVYRARNAAGITAPAVCSLDVQSATPAGGWWSDPNLTKTDGSAKTQRTASTAAQLTTLLKNFSGAAAPVYDSSTDVINLTGTITAAFNFVKPAGATKELGTQAHPLVVMHDLGASPTPAQRANFTARNGFSGAPITISAPWIWLYQLKLAMPITNVTAAVTLQGNDFFITRCLIFAPKGIANESPTVGHRYNIGFNRFDGHFDENQSGAGSDVGHCIQNLHGKNNANNPDFGHIYHNYFTADANSKLVAGNTGSQPSFFYAGDGVADVAPSTTVIHTPYDHNDDNVLFEWNYLQYGRKNTVYAKHSFHMVNNHMVKGPVPGDATTGVNGAGIGHNPGFRGGCCQRGVVAFNRIQDGSEVAVEGWFHDIIGNIINSTHIEINTHVHHDNDKELQGCEYCLIAGNNCSDAIQVGDARAGWTVVATDKLGFKSLAPPSAQRFQLVGNTNIAGTAEAAYVDGAGNAIGWSAAVDGNPTGTHNFMVQSGVYRTLARPASIVGRQGTYDLTTVPPDLSDTAAATTKTGPASTFHNATWQGGAAAAIPGAPAVGTVVSLPLDSTYLTNFAVLKGSTATVAQSSDYVEITGGADVSDDYGSVFTKAQFTFPFRVDFEYMPLDTSALPTGTFSQIYVLRAAGASVASHNVTGLPGSTNPRDLVFGTTGTLCLGARASFDTRIASGGGDNQVRFRANTTTGPSGNLNTVTTGVPVYNFTRNVWHRLSFLFQADTTIATALIADATGAFTTFATQWFGTVPGGAVDTNAQTYLKNLSAQSDMGSSGAVNVGLTASEGRHARYRRVFITAT